MFLSMGAGYIEIWEAGLGAKVCMIGFDYFVHLREHQGFQLGTILGKIFQIDWIRSKEVWMSKLRAAIFLRTTT